MNALIRKEIRLLLGPWIGAMILTVLPVWIYAESSAQAWVHNGTSAVYGTTLLSEYCYAAAVMIVALTAFGYEFTAKTFSLLLAQPIPRQSLWRSKTVVLAIAILAVIALHLLTLDVVLQFYTRKTTFHATVAGELKNAIHIAPFIAVVGYAGGLWTTLVFRNIAAAISVSVIAPIVVVMFEAWIARQFAPDYMTFMDGFVPAAFIIYAVGAFLFARWYFLRAQDVPWTGGTFALPMRKSPLFGQFSSVRRSGKIVAFVRKELQLQQISFLIAALILLCHVASFALRKMGWGMWANPATSTYATFSKSPSMSGYLLNNIWLLWLALPLLIGSSAVAEERRLGTMEALLTQPISRWVQLLIKIFLVFTLGIVFGAIVPWQIERIWNLIGRQNELNSWMGLEGAIKISVGITACAIFASAISRYTIEAICLAIVLTPLAMTGLAFISHYGEPTAYICSAVVVLTTAWLIWRNYQRPQLRSIDSAFTWAVLACSVLLGWGATSFAYNRGWEHFMRLEPRHGPAVWHRGDRLKIFSLGYGAVALLPDGRIWRAEDVNDIQYDKLKNGKVINTDILHVELTNASFIAGTNWIDLARGRKSFAIKSDGTLWCVAEFKPLQRESPRQHNQLLPPRQIGTDTNWASLSSGTWYVLALKRDGSLWGCGNNVSGELGPGPIAGFDEPKQIWSDTPWTNWTKVFAAGSTCFGFSKMEIAVTWGGQPQVPENYRPHHIADYGPVPSPFPGTNWDAFNVIQQIYHLNNDISRFALGLRTDGTLWYIAHANQNSPWSIPQKVFGQPIVPGNGLRQLGDSSDWCDITTSGHMSALKRSGEWIVNSGHWVGRDNEENVPVSRYKDWLAISAQPALIGIAADGTISCWETLSYADNFKSSRRPLWSTNVFATR